MNVRIHKTSSHAINLIFAIGFLFFLIGVFYKIATSGTSVIGSTENYIDKVYDKSLKIETYTEKESSVYSFRVKIVSTGQDRAQGLSGTKDLCTDCAMLFIFDAENIYPFWMKDMNYDLDILYLDDNKKIVDIISNVKKESYPNTVKNKNLAKYVLEINSAKAKELGIKEGDMVDF